ncbi:MAG: hypothetical protein GF350_01360 [Chitinivibrionales bacterium]|nr:hypothetical protein [Chitinivibrionales bacterium]
MQNAKFFGRQDELQKLSALWKKRSAQLVTVSGRRRIDKSTLINHFAESADRYLKFQGLVPDKGIGRAQQLSAFSAQLARQTGLPALKLSDWSEAFSLAAKTLQPEKTVILLDEISWMASGSPQLASQLQAAWEMEFKSHSSLILIVCGSAPIVIHRISKNR